MSKRAILSLLFLSTINTILFCQADTTKIIEEWFNADLGIWEVKSALHQEFEGGQLRKRAILDYFLIDDRLQFRKREEVGYNEHGQIKYELDSTVNWNADYSNIHLADYYYKDGLLDGRFRYYQGIEDVMQLSTQTFYSYDSQENLVRIQEVLISDFDDKTRMEVVYQYDENGCKIQEDIEQLSQWPDRIVYENTPDCEVIATIDYQFYPFDTIGLKKRTKTVHFDMEINGHQIIGDSIFFYSTDSTLSYHSYSKREYDENGLLVKRRTLPPSTYFEEETWEREASGHITKYTAIRENIYGDTLILPDSYERTLTFDEKGFVIADSRFFPTSGRIEKRTYDNYCNGSVRLERYDNFVPSGVPTRIYYEYANMAEQCEDLKKSTNVHVYPNPTEGIIHLETLALQESSAKIKVFSLLGQLVYQEDFSNQGTRAALDLRQLEAGNYILQIVGNNQYAAEKIVIKPH